MRYTCALKMISLTGHWHAMRARVIFWAKLAWTVTPQNLIYYCAILLAARKSTAKFTGFPYHKSFENLRKASINLRTFNLKILDAPLYLLFVWSVTICTDKNKCQGRLPLELKISFINQIGFSDLAEDPRKWNMSTSTEINFWTWKSFNLPVMGKWDVYALFMAIWVMMKCTLWTQRYFFFSFCKILKFRHNEGFEQRMLLSAEIMIFWPQYVLLLYITVACQTREKWEVHEPRRFPALETLMMNTSKHEFLACLRQSGITMNFHANRLVLCD